MKTILCVDDEPMILKALKRELGHMARILTAESASEALRIVSDEDVDVVISDCRMPVMNGVELMQMLRVTHPNIVRVLLTGSADVGMTMAAINDGQVYRFITKPWKRDELILVVKRCLEQRQRLIGSPKQAVALDGLESAFPGISQKPRLHGATIELDDKLLEEDSAALLASLCN